MKLLGIKVLGVEFLVIVIIVVVVIVIIVEIEAVVPSFELNAIEFGIFLVFNIADVELAGVNADFEAVACPSGTARPEICCTGAEGEAGFAVVLQGYFRIGEFQALVCDVAQSDALVAFPYIKVFRILSHGGLSQHYGSDCAE